MEEITLGQKYPDDIKGNHWCNPINAIAKCEECGEEMRPITITSNAEIYRVRELDKGCCDYYECPKCGYASDWIKGASELRDGS